jgi:SAM-dependent methyltransferase
VTGGGDLHELQPALKRGVSVPPHVTGVVDVLLSGRRIWSFNADRDVDEHGFVVWPTALSERMRGRVEWQLVDHATGQVHRQGSARVDDREEVFELLDEDGHPSAIDKGGALDRTFADSDGHRRAAVVDGVNAVLADLRGHADAQAFLAFGCLLGAMRDGRLIGHDTDADVAVLCPGTAPVDVMLQSYRLEHLMVGRGWSTTRMSGGGFKVHVDTGDGSHMGVDVFSAWHDDDGVFHLMPHVSGSLARETLLPVGSVGLEERQVVAPRRPESLLALTYGPGWSVPDPSFTYKVPAAVRRRMSSWFRGERRSLRDWDSIYSEEHADLPPERSEFAAWVKPQLTRGADLLEVGCGPGRDSVWFAGSGTDVTAYDYSPAARSRTRAAAENAGVRVHVGSMNLQDHRDVLVAGAELAFTQQARDVYCRFVLELLGPSDRAMFWRFCSMVQRRGGRTFVECRLDENGSGELDRLVLEAQAAGGSIEHASTGSGWATQAGEDPLVGRVVVSWDDSEMGT